MFKSELLDLYLTSFGSGTAQHFNYRFYRNKIVDHTSLVFPSSTAPLRADPHVYDLESQSARNARDLRKVSGVLWVKDDFVYDVSS